MPPLLARPAPLPLLAGPGRPPASRPRLAPAPAHEERPASFPDGTGERPALPGLGQPPAPGGLQEGQRRRIARMPAELKQRNQALLRSAASTPSRTPSTPSAAAHVDLRAARRLHASASRPAPSSRRTAATSRPTPQHRSRPVVHRKPATRHAPGRQAGGSRAPAPSRSSYADQYRCPTTSTSSRSSATGPRRRLDRLQQPVLRDPDRGHRRAAGGRDHRQQVRRSSTRSAPTGWAASTCATSPSSRPSSTRSTSWRPTASSLDRVVARGNDEYGILAFAVDHGRHQELHDYCNGDSAIYPGSASDLNGDNTSFDADPLRDRDLRQPQPPQHAGLLRHGGQLGLRPPQRVLRQRRRHRDRLAVPRPPRAAAGPRPVERQPIYANNINYYTRSSTPASAPADAGARLHAAARSARSSRPRRHRRADRRRQLQPVEDNRIYDNWR